LATVYLSEEPGEIKTILSTQKEKLTMFLFYNYCWDDNGGGWLNDSNKLYRQPFLKKLFASEQNRDDFNKLILLV